MKAIFYVEAVVDEEIEDPVEVHLTRLAGGMPPIKRFENYDKVKFETALTKREITVFDWFMKSCGYSYDMVVMPVGVI